LQIYVVRFSNHVYFNSNWKINDKKDSIIITNTGCKEATTQSYHTLNIDRENKVYEDNVITLESVQ
jgi:hypothetical protein